MQFSERRRLNIKQSSKIGFLFFIAGVLSVLAFPFNPLVIFKVVEPNNIEVLWYVGWIFWAVGIALIILPYYHFYYRKVNVLVDSGIYGTIRHPFYSGFITWMIFMPIVLDNQFV